MDMKPLGCIVSLHPIKLKKMEKVKIHFPAEFSTELVMLSSHTLVDDAKYFFISQVFLMKIYMHEKAIRRNALGLSFITLKEAIVNKI